MGRRGTRVLRWGLLAIVAAGTWLGLGTGRPASAAEPTIEIDCCDTLGVVYEEIQGVVTVTDGDGNPAVDVRVLVATVAGPGVGHAGTKRTDTEGKAFFLKTGQGVGTDQIVAKAWVDDEVVVAGARQVWASSAPDHVVLSQETATSPVGSSNRLTAVVTDADGGPVQGAHVGFERDGALHLDEATDATGTATYTTSTDTPRVETFAAEVLPDGPRSEELTHTWTPIPVLALTGDPVNAIATDHSVVAHALAADGNPAPGVVVDFEVGSGPNAGKSGQATTDIDGNAQFTYTGSATSGIDTIVAHFEDATFGTIDASPLIKTWAPVTGHALVLGPPTSTQRVANDVEVTGVAVNDGVPLAGVQVTFDVVSGPDAGTTEAHETSADGLVSLHLAGRAVGTDTVRASFDPGTGTIISNDVTVVWTPGPSIVLTPETSTDFVGGIHTVTASVTDIDGSPLGGMYIELGVVGSNHLLLRGVSDELGQATFEYMGMLGGTDEIGAYGGDETGIAISNTVTADWVDLSLTTLTLEPAASTNPVGSDHTVTATLVDEFDAPVPGVSVEFDVTAGPHRGMQATATTDDEGKATFTYTGRSGGTDTIGARIHAFGIGPVRAGEVTKTWDGEAKATIVLVPEQATSPANAWYAGRAYVNDATGDPVGAGLQVRFDVVSGPNAGLAVTDETGGDGTAFFEYLTIDSGTDTIVATASVDGIEVISNESVITWTGDPVVVLHLEPETATNLLGEEHAVIASLTYGGEPATGEEVEFEVTDGPNAGVTASLTTGDDGTAAFKYTSKLEGTDTIVARTTRPDERTVTSNEVTKTWEREEPAGVSFTLTPGQANGEVGTEHTVTAILIAATGAPISGVEVSFAVTDGPHKGTSGKVTTDSEGKAAFTYKGATPGTDSIAATAPVGDLEVKSNPVSMTWHDPQVTADELPFTGGPMGRMMLLACLFVLGGAGGVALSARRPSGHAYVPRHMR